MAVNAAAFSGPSAASMTPELEDRIRGALWGLFAGDALAAPSHWYYGGSRQVKQDYGAKGLTGYTKPVLKLPGSIMSKSNVNGGGRGTFSRAPDTIIGGVINHGKLDFWEPGKDYHYHCTLDAGENTLEASLVRVLLRYMAEGGCSADPTAAAAAAGSGGGDWEAGFRARYVDFMTTPGSHNDCYASTCHRMFFFNLRRRGLEPARCPDNDQHNVDTIDGLALPTVAALAAVAQAVRGAGSDGDPTAAAAAAAA
eukprot:CAMPEP_0172602786 /NCGR_PEP_ID=MMETSP1068-20121228/22962_1 /TAXON_ID=35684 /ORGANISM="Pseudopedinella elastica, Strain CCMP716" /LENGTH=253 /DNA_ID=CAMNT_0013404269 /DNA_START=108 /DNA_END=866 /DNA_ORIENTATION=-